MGGHHVVGDRIVRLVLQPLPQNVGCLVKFVTISQDGSQVSIDVRYLGPQKDRPSIGRGRLIKPAQAFQDVSQIEMRLGTIGTQFDGFRTGDGCFFRFPSRRNTIPRLL